MTKVIERPKQETLTRPPGKWWNWWKTRSPWRVKGTEKVFMPGMVHPSQHGPWPTKEIAEQRAIEWLNGTSSLGKPNNELDEYLGAYPEGERP
jgi:hypothetical protein